MCGHTAEMNPFRAHPMLSVLAATALVIAGGLWLLSWRSDVRAESRKAEVIAHVQKTPLKVDPRYPRAGVPTAKQLRGWEVDTVSIGGGVTMLMLFGAPRCTFDGDRWRDGQGRECWRSSVIGTYLDGKLVEVSYDSAGESYKDRPAPSAPEL